MKNFLIVCSFSMMIFLFSGCGIKNDTKDVTSDNQVGDKALIKGEQKQKQIDNQKQVKDDDNLKSCSDGSLCEEGYLCYQSRYAGMGEMALVFGEEEGDLLCHKECSDDSECKIGKCEDVELLDGDLVRNVKFCK